MKKSLLAIGLSLTMVLAMATPAFAANTNANVNADGTEVTLPGHPDYAAGNIQLSKESYNEATITNKAGVTTPTATDWEVLNDDDALAKTADSNGADINVWAKVVDSGSKIYKVDLAWGAMKFEYDSGTGKWDTEKHVYTTTGGTAAWTATYLDGTNNKVAITNHSNNAINAAFAYAMDSNKPFNAVNGVDNVIGNFFADNNKAAAAALVLKATYKDTNGAVSDTLPADKLAGSAVALPTADAYNSTAGNDPTAANATGNQVAGARTENVFFAFSGTPDAGKGATLDTFKKVGVITVTVTPNNEFPLNRPAFKTV